MSNLAAVTTDCIKKKLLDGNLCETTQPSKTARGKSTKLNSALNQIFMTVLVTENI